MAVETVIRFYAILAMVANVAVAGLVVAWLVGRHDRLVGAIGPWTTLGALIVATLATAGSLYFSEAAHFEPCRLCWFQRIAMYPLVPILAVAVVTGDRGVWRYGLVLASVGAVISAYHYAVEWLPSLGAGACDARMPCSVVWFREFGFVSLPYLALSAFLLIAGLLWVGAHDPGAERPMTLQGEPA
jgi:disulfide bond formation protein DsbB